MNVNQVVRTITIKGVSDGVEKVTADVNRLASAQENVAVVSEQSARRTLSIADAWRKQTLALDEAARSSSRAASATKVAESALAEGLISTQKYATRLDLIAQKYGVVTAAAEKFARAQSLATVNTAPAVNQRLGVKDDFGTALRANDIAAYGKQLDDVRAKYNPLFAAGRQYRETLAEINQAAKIGAISEKERAAAVDSTKASFVQHVGVLRTFKQSTDDATKSTGLARYEMINLGRQGADVFTQLASGQGLFITAVQQGPQVLDIFATSQGRVVDALKSGVGWLGRFATSAAGIATGVIGIGAAAIFAATQFARASTTIEQALEEQNRLLKEGKALLDARTSAEARAQLQSKEQTQFETLRNQLDLQIKLNKAMEDAAKVGGSRSTTPTGGGMPEMGIAPSGVAPSKDPGLAAMAGAVDTLMTAMARGEPGIKQFNSELGKIGMAHPELALIVQDMIKAGEAGLQLEFAAQRAKAMSDALKGIATDAQMAAVGLNSVAQFKLNNLQANEGRESAERQAAATLMIRDAWGGVSIEAAKTLDTLSRQLDVAQAVGQMAQIEAQHKANIAELSQHMSVSEATRIADLQRAVALAQIESQHKETMVALQGQLSVAKQVTGIGQINAQYEATVASLSLQIGQVKAIEQAEAQRAISIAQVNADADRMLINLQQQGELINASSDAERDRIAARQTYQNLVDKGTDSTKAQAVAAKQLQNAEEERAKTQQRAHDAAIRSIESIEDHMQRAAAAQKAYNDGLIEWGLKSEIVGRAMARQAQDLEDAAWAMNRAAGSIFNAANSATIAFNAFVPFSVANAGDAPSALAPTGIVTNKAGGRTQFNPEGYQFKTSVAAGTSFGPGSINTEAGFNSLLAASGSIGSSIEQIISGGFTTKPSGGLSPSLSAAAGGFDEDKLQLFMRTIDLLSGDQKAGALQRAINQLRSEPSSLASMEAINQLTQSLEQLKTATNENTSATQAMTDVLSPFYSSDPRTTRLGFRAFAGGGIMTPWGELPINRYDGGGIARSPQVSIFGEGSTPEAYVPVPNGRIPVQMSQPANNNQPPPITISIRVEGNADASTVDALKRTAYQQAQGLRRVAMGR